MSDVTVRISAKNDTRTGFQEALGDAKKFGSEASRSISGSMQGAMSSRGKGGFEIGGSEIRRSLKSFGREIASASSPAEAFEAVIGGISHAFGRFTGAVAAFIVVQTVIEKFKKLKEAVSESNTQLDSFGKTAREVSRSADFSGALSSFDKMQDRIDEARSKLKELKGDWGAVFANGLQFGTPFKDIEQNIRNMQELASNSVMDASKNSRNAASENVSAYALGGNDAVKQAEIERKRDEERAKLRRDMEVNKRNPSAYDKINRSLQDNEQRYRDEDNLEKLRSRSSKNKQAQNLAEQMFQSKEQMEMSSMSDNEKLARLRTRIKQTSGSAGQANEIGILNQQYTAQFHSLLKQMNDRRDSLRAANAEKAATAGMTDEQLLARERGKRNALDDSALQSGKYSNEDQIKREEITQRILDLEARIKQTRESGLKGLEQRAADKQFAAMKPEQQQSFVQQKMADLEQQIKSGTLTGPEAFQRANQLLGMQESLGQGGFQGSAGASAFQRIGFASNEFFDTRKQDNPTKAAEKAAKFAEQIVKLLEGLKEPVILNPTAR